MKTRTILLATALLAFLAACTPMPELDGMLASSRDNTADPGGTAYAASWKVLGTGAVSSGTATFVNVAIDGAVPYVAFAQGSAVLVKKFASGAWVAQPVNTAAATISNLAFAVNSATPYIAYGRTATTPECKYLTSGSWADVGALNLMGFTTLFQNPSLAFSGTNLFLAVNDTSWGYAARFDGSSWTKDAFADATVNPSSIGMAFGGGLPILSFLNHYAGVSSAASVKQTTTAAWPPIGWSFLTDSGSNAISNMNMEETSIVVVGGVPYVAFMITGSVTVRKYSAANTWTTVGSASFVNSGHNIKLAANAAGEVFIAFKDTSNANKITVMKFNGTAWVNVGAPGFSGAVVSSLGFAISQTDGTLYVAYDNASDTNQAHVMTFN